MCADLLVGYGARAEGERGAVNGRAAGGVAVVASIVDIDSPRGA